MHRSTRAKRRGTRLGRGDAKPAQEQRIEHSALTEETRCNGRCAQPDARLDSDDGSMEGIRAGPRYTLHGVCGASDLHDRLLAIIHRKNDAREVTLVFH